MRRTFILPTGTSIVRGLERAGLSAAPGFERAALTRQALEQVGAGVASLSAELSALSLVGFDPEADSIFLLTTDTPAGKRAASLLQYVVEVTYDVPLEIRTITGLAMDDTNRFRVEGLPNLVQALDQLVTEAGNAGSEVIIGVGSGIKPVVPYLAVYAMLRRVKLAYTFESPAAVLWLPRLPIGFDMEAIGNAAPVLRQIAQDSSIPRAAAVGRLGQDFDTLEGLFETTGNDELTLSAFGFLVDNALQTADQTQVLLSHRAAQTLAAADGISRWQIEFALARVGNPLWRGAKVHSFRGTDLTVWKPGSTAQRVAGWVTQGTVYVAELYLDHETYETDLPTRRLDRYDPSKFTPWTPSPDGEVDRFSTDEIDEERIRLEFDARLTAANRLSTEAHQHSQILMTELDDARLAALIAQDQAATLGADLAAARTGLSTSEQAAASVGKRLAVYEALGFTGRLRWALTGRLKEPA